MGNITSVLQLTVECKRLVQDIFEVFNKLLLIMYSILIYGLGADQLIQLTLHTHYFNTYVCINMGFTYKFNTTFMQT